MKPWRPARPDAVELDPECMQASVGRLLEALAETRRERDQARAERDRLRVRVEHLHRSLDAARGWLHRLTQPRRRPRSLPVPQLNLSLESPP